MRHTNGEKRGGGGGLVEGEQELGWHESKPCVSRPFIIIIMAAVSPGITVMATFLGGSL